MAAGELVEEVVPLGARALTIVRPRDSEALLDEHAFDQEELLPYWAELWPSGVGLARALAGRSLRGARALELGCGLGLASIAAAAGGARVLATDWSAEAVRFAARNAERNGVRVETLVCSWTEPEPLVRRGPWDLVLAADVLYERRMVDELLDVLPRLGGEVWLADPGRVPADDFLARAAERWEVRSRRDPRHSVVSVHRLTPRQDG